MKSVVGDGELGMGMGRKGRGWELGMGWELELEVL